MDYSIRERLEIEATKYPAKCCLPIFIAEPPKNNSEIHNGTVSFYRSNTHLIGITCNHIIEEYQSLKNNKSDALIQIGNHRINLEGNLIDQNQKLDLATFKFSNSDYQKMKEQNNGTGEIIPSIISSQLNTSDHIAFGGFIGEWVSRPEKNTLIFDTFSIGDTQIVTVEEDQFSCRIDNLKNYKEVFNYFNRSEPKNIGGLSGGPILKIIQNQSGIIHWELAGIIYEGRYDSGTLKLYGRFAKLIQDNGKIKV